MRENQILQNTATSYPNTISYSTSTTTTNALLLFQFPNRDMMQWQFQNQKPPSDHLVIIQRGNIVKMGKKESEVISMLQCCK